MVRPWISFAANGQTLSGIVICAHLLSGCASSGAISGRLVLPGARPSSASEAAQSNPAESIASEGPCDAVITVRAAGVKGKREAEPDPRPKSSSSAESTNSATAAITHTAAGFEPHVLAVKVGTMVEFLNRDEVYHQVFSISPAKRFDLGSQAPGERRAVVFDSLGVVNLYCELHPATAGYVVILPDDHFTQPNANGEFVLSGLPNGAYTVRAWHPRYGEVKREVSVPDDGKLELRLAD